MVLEVFAGDQPCVGVQGACGAPFVVTSTGELFPGLAVEPPVAWQPSHVSYGVLFVGGSDTIQQSEKLYPPLPVSGVATGGVPLPAESVIGPKEVIVFPSSETTMRPVRSWPPVSGFTVNKSSIDPARNRRCSAGSSEPGLTGPM